MFKQTDTKQGQSSTVFNIKTNIGNIKILLFCDKAPITTKNFTKYALDGFYDGTIFHRVIKGFMVQGGGFESGLQEKNNRASIKNEANNGLSNKRGTLAMARTQEPHSASAQFFINLTDNDFLDFKNESVQGWGYCVFAEVVEGMDIVDKMTLVETGNLYGHGDVPKEDIVVNSIVLLDSNINTNHSIFSDLVEEIDATVKSPSLEAESEIESKPTVRLEDLVEDNESLNDDSNAYCGYSSLRKAEKKVKNAIKSYGNGDDYPSDVIFLIDDTVFGGAKEGFYLTSNKIYMKGSYGDPISIYVSDIERISFRGDDLKVNNKSINLTCTASHAKYVKRFVSCVNEYIEQ